jgi:predicted nucleic acid-binding protein
VIYVIDASVAVKWFVAESLRDEALRLFDHTAARHAPDWIVLEVARAALRKWRDDEITMEQAHLMIQALPIRLAHLHRAVEFSERALTIAMAIRHSVYDCLYVACAERLGGTVITADVKFLATLKNSEFSNLARHLTDV